MKANIEAFIVISAWTVYCIMVFSGKANIEGFVALTVYIVKKFLDMLETEEKK